MAYTPFVPQWSIMAMELARRTKKFDHYRDNLRDSEKCLKKATVELASLKQRISTLEMESSSKDSKICRLQERLKEERRQGLLEGMQGCREQILITPMGQYFLSVLK